MSALLGYPVELEPDDNGTLLATCPDLPGVVTFGEDQADAVLRATDATLTMLAARIDDREDIPMPSPAEARPVARLPTQAAAKIALYGAMRAAGVGKAELARRLGRHGPQVDRLLDLGHASRLDQVDQAFPALGKRLVVDVRDAA